MSRGPYRSGCQINPAWLIIVGVFCSGMATAATADIHGPPSRSLHDGLAVMIRRAFSRILGLPVPATSRFLTRSISHR